MTDSGHEKTEKLLGTIEKKLTKIYDQASNEVGEKFNAFMEKNMKRYDSMWAKYEKGEITLEQFQDWAKGGITGKRYSALLDTLATDCVNADKIAMSVVNGYLPEAYAFNRNYAFYQLEANGVDLGSTFTLYDRQAVEKLARGKASLLPKPKVDIPKDQQWNRKHIRNAITQGVLQGESIPKIAKRLQNVVGMDHNAAVRNARTAMTGAQNAGRVRGYKDAKSMGINVMQEWLATQDDRTRESHLALDGERIEIGGVFSNGCEYPGDPGGPPEEVYNCRCTLIPYLPDYDVDLRGGGEEDFDEWQDAQADDEKARLDEAIANAREFSEEEHIEMNFDEDGWRNLSEDERRAVEKYTGSYYDSMNSALRSGDTLSQGKYVGDLITNCESALNNFSLQEDTLLYRGMGKVSTLAGALGVDERDILEMAKSGDLDGLRFVERGFCSTGISSNAGWGKPVTMEIVAPRGTLGLYVDPISENQGELECLLQHGTTFEIRGAEVKEKYSEWSGQTRKMIALKVVVVGQS